MTKQLNRRQLIQLGGSFLGGVIGTSILGDSALGESIFKAPRRRIDPRILPNRPRIRDLLRKTTFYTQGRHLYHPSGTKVILRGANFPLLDDWGFPQTNTLAEFVKTGANAIRIQWYKNYGQSNRPAYGIGDLDRFLTACKDNQIIPILYLSDLTCQSNPDLLNTQLMPWWTDPNNVAVFQKHERYLIVNFANELGHYRWTGDRNTALNKFKEAYKTAIATFRQTGLKMPIAIDAPDCGSSIEVFPAIAQELINADPQKNILFSGHAYWAAYQGIPHIQAAINADIPLFLGEVANKQDENGNNGTLYCHYDLDGGSNNPAQNGFTYQSLLTQLKTQEIGWLAWCWWKDGCGTRQMTNDGTIANLTAYGKDIVNNLTYGLKTTAVRSLL